ncbi:MAG: T9SS type A sorting domain-containing protein [Bacteroidales bacterium]|nr:T9SS type A sorting domain-containing protein [Bacteroidales bacterium]
MKTTTLILLSIFLTCQGVLSQKNTSFANAMKQIENRGEVYFRFANSKQLDVTMLGKSISIDHKTDSEWVYAYANRKGFKVFSKQINDFEVLQPPSTLLNPVMKSEVVLKNTDEWDFYPTYDAYINMMYQFEEDYPELCTIVSFGETVEGRELLAARISDNTGDDPGEPQFLYTATMHGDETAGYVLMLRLINYLLENYATDQQVAQLVNHLDIWINPLANPDGTYHSGNETVYGSTRYNANNVDLNRNFHDPEDGPHPDGNEYQPETLAFMELADDNRFLMAANFHGGFEVFNYPWDTWSQLHADDDWWQFTGREWADTVHKYAPSGYFDELNNGITNGYQWYTTSGSRQDYMNYFHHCREVTLEISTLKLFPPGNLPDLWEYNYRSFLNFMKQSLYGFTGTVKESWSGNPLEATITLVGHESNNSEMVSNPMDGYFFRPVFEGTYDIKVNTENSEKIFESVAIQNYEQIYLDVLLSEEDIVSSTTNMVSLGPNPVTDHILVYFSNMNTNSFTIAIYTSSGQMICNNSFKPDKTDQTFRIDLPHISPGILLIEIEGKDFHITKKLVKQ